MGSSLWQPAPAGVDERCFDQALQLRLRRHYSRMEYTGRIVIQEAPLGFKKQLALLNAGTQVGKAQTDTGCAATTRVVTCGMSHAMLQVHIVPRHWTLVGKKKAQVADTAMYSHGIEMAHTINAAFVLGKGPRAVGLLVLPSDARTSNAVS